MATGSHGGRARARSFCFCLRIYSRKIAGGFFNLSTNKSGRCGANKATFISFFLRFLRVSLPPMVTAAAGEGIRETAPKEGTQMFGSRIFWLRCRTNQIKLSFFSCS